MSDEINRLPPALREKKRYLKFKIRSEEEVELGEVVNTVWNSVLNYTGSKGASEADIWIIGNKFSEKHQEGVIKVNRDKASEIRAALSLIDGFNGKKGFIEVKKKSGSLNQLD